MITKSRLSPMCLRVVFGVSLVAVVTSPVAAGVSNLGGGWEALWDSSLDGSVSITSLGVVDDAVFIQKSAEFTQPPVNGIFPAIPIVFRQIDASAVGNIVIENEIITNSTGVAWTDFHMQLINGNDAAFDPAATANSGGPGPIGFTIDPFTQAAFTPDNRGLDLWDGVVSDQTTWTPGNGVAGGQLWIDVAVGDGVNQPFTLFTLKETPTPEPAALMLLAIGGLALLQRRR